MNGQEYEEICEEFATLLGLMEAYGAMGGAYKAVEMAHDVFMGESFVMEEGED